MSTVIGGPFRCNIHPDFGETDDVNLWNEHCSTTEGHTISGVIPCMSCGGSIELNEIPYQKIGSDTKLQCPDCFESGQDLNRLVNSQQKSKVETPEVVETQSEVTTEGKTV